MVFSTSSQYIRLEPDLESDKLYLFAELDNDGDWQLCSVCLDNHVGVSQEYKGFDTTPENTASAQGTTLRSLFVPGSLTLKGGSVLSGKVRDEHGGWETSIYLDLLFKNQDGALVKNEWANNLLVSAGVVANCEDRDNVRALLLASNGKLAPSQLSLVDNCEYMRTDAFEDEWLRPMSDRPDRYVVSDVWLDRTEGHTRIVGMKRQANTPAYQQFHASLIHSLSNSKGKLSPEQPEMFEIHSLPDSANSDLQDKLANVGFAIAGVDELTNEATRAHAQCVYSAVMACGILVSRIFYGKVGASYAPAMGAMAGLAVKSATGRFVSDPKMRDEVAAVAISRVLKAELPAITGLTAKEVFDYITNAAVWVTSDEKTNLRGYINGAWQERRRRKLDESLVDGVTDGWQQIIIGVRKTLIKDLSEDGLKHLFDDKRNDGVDLLSPPAAGEDDYLSKWVRDIKDLQDQLYALESDIVSPFEDSTQEALESITTGLAGLNELLEFWPEYKGDDTTNEKRLAIIQTAAGSITDGQNTVEEADQDTSVLQQVLGIENTLKGLKTKFTDEANAEQAELDGIKPNLQTAVEKMFADLKLYQSAQNELTVKIKQVADAELKYNPDATIEGGVKWYKDLLRRRTSALQTPQSAADTAATNYLASEKVVVDMQAHQALINNIHKRRFSVQREISKAEMIIDDLKIMYNGMKAEDDRILDVVKLLKPTFEELTHIGEPPYHRQDRKIEDQLCTAVLKAHRESLIDSSFVESAKKAVTEIQSWFDDDYTPEGVKEEIDAIMNNALYKASS